ncbi:hypothetical protein C8Q80DRAFT_198851 [Daedaleopsis nitida]|nr:hypothetical protein C8Q80DRAFT_198851 [Daedaleopsis nitida]
MSHTARGVGLTHHGFSICFYKLPQRPCLHSIELPSLFISPSVLESPSPCIRLPIRVRESPFLQSDHIHTLGPEPRVSPSNMLSPLAANMAATALECTFYGIFLVLSATSFVLLVRRRAGLMSGNSLTVLSPSVLPRRLSWSQWLLLGRKLAQSPLFVANVLFLLTITAHWVVVLHILFIGEVDLAGGVTAITFYTNLHNKWIFTKNAILLVDMLLGDSVIPYRAWIVWGRDYRVVVVPIMTIFALITFGIGLLYVGFTGSQDVFNEQLGRWITGYCVATLCTNLYGTGVIAYRMWATNRRMRKTGALSGGLNGGDLTNALAIFVESAVLYSGWAVMYIGLYTARSPLQTVGAQCGPAIIGIAFTLITVRVGLGLGHGSKSPVPSTGAGTMQFGSLSAMGQNQTHISENSFSMRTIALTSSSTARGQDADYAFISNAESMKAPESVGHYHGSSAPGIRYCIWRR